MNKAKWVSRGLIYSPYWIGLCKDEASFKREIKRMKVPPAEAGAWMLPGADATVHFFRTYTGRLVALVCVRKFKTTRSGIDTLLVHETVHIWQRIKESLGEVAPSNEFEAYAIQNMSRELIDAYHAG